VNYANAQTSKMVGSMPNYYTNPEALELFVRNGHLPAYAPNTLNTYGLTLPTGWQAQNDYRWANDPYAETATRFLNEITSHSFSEAIPSADEGTLSGYAANGSEITVSRLSGTTNNNGIGFGSAGQYDGMNDRGQTGNVGETLAALSPALSVLAGTPL